MDLSRQISKACPDVNVEGFVGRSGSFEVSINDELIFSKLKLGGFPVFQQVIDQVMNTSQGGKPEILDNSESPGCTIL